MQGLVYSHLLQAVVLLLAGTLLYSLMFWRSTFLRWNRVLLWSILLASLILPFVHLPAAWTVHFWQKKEAIAAPKPNLETGGGLPEPQFFYEINPAEQVTTLQVEENLSAKQPQIPITPLLFLLYALGCFVFGIRFLIHLFSLFKLFRKAHLEQRDGYYLAFCHGELSPFAFGRTIFLSEALLQSEDLKLILAHELAHVRQRHTLDILAAELLLVWQWFNPGAWLYRRLVETNLEYLADRSVLQQQWNKKQYQLSLLNWSNANVSNSLSTSYNFSLLKERIMMMNRKPASKVYLLGYAVVLVLLPMLSVFNQPVLIANPASPLQRSEAIDQALIDPGLAQSVTISGGKLAPGLPKPTTKNVEYAVDTIVPKQDEKKFFVLVFSLKLTNEEQEKLLNLSLPWGRKLEVIRSDKGKIIGARIISPSGGSCAVWHDENYELPIVIYGEPNGCSTGTFDQDFLNKLIANQWENTIELITLGLPNDKIVLEAYRQKITDHEQKEIKERLEKLASNNWVESASSGSTTYRIPVQEKSWEYVKKKIGDFATNGKQFIVSINGQVFESILPEIDISKVKKMILYEGRKTEYIPGTLMVKRTEPANLRLEIDMD
ncbi:MAG: M56 family metallopeptidase [Haliscomenobacter sp.]|uniref:M56 family metallopeptidase n=1 Tax=Haliscomenobacter sp. TaxID=2717303 RepID=UPI0029A3AC64|nr:M56 family metallopeptidase [Haliscomenobacter sp.]MDX2072130.1 M56 family metallopeptidase [Haliscomenobacter sp.]